MIKMNLKMLDLIRTKRRDYQLCFGSPAGTQVLKDLARFCRATETCVVPGDRDRTLVLEGRREVWLKIEQYICMDAQTLYRLLVQEIPVNEGDE